MLDPRADEEAIYSHGLTGIAAVKSYLSSIGRRDGQLTDSESVAGNLQAIAECWQARPVDKKISVSGQIARMLDPQWWTRNLRRAMLRENEANERAAGNIRRSKQCYVSDFGLKRTKERAKKNRETLEALEVMNEAGEAVNLLEVADASVSNPKLRRGELMTRCRGFEEMAEVMGHEAVFLTITAPSRFHKFSQHGDNKKWTGETTSDAQGYLCKVFAKIRAAWKRLGLVVYGFRVSEPHHDGCVHWHLLLFVEAAQVGWFDPALYQTFVDQKRRGHIGPMLPVVGPSLSAAAYGGGVVGIAGAYALQSDALERGAAEHRFTCVNVDKSRGSATGYIAKYICKNIDGIKEDGAQVGLDFDSGTDAEAASQSVRAWACINGIRQFQQIGGPSVTVWRELRRLEEDAEKPIQLQLFEGARAAADQGNWMAFWSVQGGTAVAKSDLALSPAYTSEETGKYGDAVERVHGVNSKCGSFIKTRAHTWRIQRAGRADVDRVDNFQRSIFKKYGSAMAVAMLNPADFDPEFLGAERPRTGVNNCTADAETSDDFYLRLDLLRGQGGPIWDESPPHRAAPGH